MIFGYKVYLPPDQYVIFDGNTAHVEERTDMIDEYVFADLNEPPEVSIKWRKYNSALVQPIIKRIIKNFKSLPFHR